MSGVEAGATIVGLVGFGLTSLKTIYQFISNVKDGPEKVRDLANDLKNLQAAYERIEALDDLPGFASSPSLTDLIKNCNESIGKLQKKIGKLQVRPNDKFHGIVWKRLKMAFNDDEIAQMLDALSGYVNKFTLEISVIELRLMHQNAGHMSQLVAGGERHFAMARQHHSILDKVEKDVGEFFPQIQQVQNGVDAVAVKITSMQSLSVRQSVGIAERLEKLETEVARMSLRNKAPVNDYGIHDTMWAVPLEETQNSTILASIRNLCGLVDRRERHIESDEAQDIIEDLETLLHDLNSSKSNCQRAFTSSVAMESLATEKELSRDIRRFRGILSSSTDVTLNHFITNQNSSAELVGKVNKSIQTWTQHKSQHGHWIISTQKRWRRNTFEDGDKTIQDSIASVLFKPKGSHSQFVIKATVQQFQRIHGFYSAAPSLTVSRIRPRSSRVFHCVRLGDMAGLLQLLASGEASLQDRDDRGASLLHYSFEQPKMSQFLIEHGADPDDIAQCDHLLSEMPWWAGEEYIAEAHSRVDNSCYEEVRLTEDRVASLGTSHLDESVKTWLSKSSVSSDMSDSSSVASLRDLRNTEVGFSEEVYENPWAEG
ncbi:hypothetical protein CGLO_15167 [Colletotrichum gloeosporioides Cg-14]|uniref:Azaphilone pigments biosynthesis cluster protein L N-terminal domain-containing protein n=1 Tax=Colletotrichum gloeosporioides (strain Cg-14) TaxID=1237896 RepID=T0JRK0_COLGC|nr:hypothetical protein CGLO_15167 [Colletotrichum gloeosporioides Cg-14]